MSIKTLLNPPDKSCTMDETTDFDIFQAVMEAWREHKSDGGDEELDITMDIVVKPHQMHKEALQAGLVMQEYLQELNIPYADTLNPL
jgi:hypothetical protein